MPYLKFLTKQDDDLAWDIIDNFLEENGKVTGLLARINTQKHGIVSFFSEEPYMKEINTKRLTYTIIPKDEISNIIIDSLRKSHPEYADEL